MKNVKRCKVEVRKDHLSKVASGTAKFALAELIWNSLDADAKNVSINFIDGTFGVENVIVSDDGTAIPYEQAENIFSSLGGSWKVTKQRTPGGRFLHGQSGQGRFKAFALGRIVDWKIIYEKDGKYFEYTIEGKADALDEFTVSDTTESSSRTTGVTVEVSELEKNFHILKSDNALEQLAPLFAPYLSNYKNVVLTIAGQKVDPDILIRNRQTFSLSTIKANGELHSAELELVEWENQIESSIWFCDSNGFPLDHYVKRIKGTNNLSYSAYIKSEYFRDLHNQGRLSLGELEQSLHQVCDEAIKIIKDYCIARQLEEAKDQLEEWKNERIYPYIGDPVTRIEEVERKVFDIVAININHSLPGFRESEKKSKQFQLRMLRCAIEKSPDDLQIILTEVLNLPQRAREELALLLKDTSLTSIINASRIVTDRINFITALEQLLYKHTDHLKERSQLHQLLAKNTWIFGETFTLSVNDKSLTEVLRKHIELQKIEMVIDEPVKRLDGSKGVIDLMLSRQIPRYRENELEHIVVELKRPSVVIGKDEIDQIEGYALAVAKDERFLGVYTKWHFWIIANEYNEYAETKLSAFGNKDGVLFRYTKNVDITVTLKTWPQLLQENNHRLRFIREALEYNIDSDNAMRHLKKTYAQYIKGIEIPDEIVE